MRNSLLVGGDMIAKLKNTNYKTDGYGKIGDRRELCGDDSSCASRMQRNSEGGSGHASVTDTAL